MVQFIFYNMDASGIIQIDIEYKGGSKNERKRLQKL